MAAINFSWNIYNVHRAKVLRTLDHERATFASQVVTPIEGSLVKLEDFLIEARAVARTTYDASPASQKKRAEAYEKLQKSTFEPARDSLNVALQRASDHSNQPFETKWHDYADRLDPALTALDTLCRATSPADRLQLAVTAVNEAVRETCATIRQDTDIMLRKIGSLG